MKKSKKKNPNGEPTPLSDLVDYLGKNCEGDVIDVHVHVGDEDEFLSEPCSNSKVNNNLAIATILFRISLDAQTNPQIQSAMDTFKINSVKFLENIGELANMYAFFGLEEAEQEKINLN